MLRTCLVLSLSLSIAAATVIHAQPGRTGGAGGPAQGIGGLRTALEIDMQRAAARFGIAIDTDSLCIVSCAEGAVVDANVEGFELLTGPHGFIGGANVALVLVLGDDWSVPPGHYVMRITLEPQGRRFIPSIHFIDDRGRVFDMPVTEEVIPGRDPFAARGPRGTVLVDRGEVALTKYISCPDIDLLALWCFRTTLQAP